MPLGDRARTVALRPLPWKLESPRASRGGVRRGGCFVNRAAEQDSRADAAPAQRFGTDGIKPMGRPSLVTRAFMRVVAFAERLNVALSKVGNPPIYDEAVLPWPAPASNRRPTSRSARGPGPPVRRSPASSR